MVLRRRWTKALTWIGAGLAGLAVWGPAAAAVPPDAERLLVLHTECGAASAVRVTTTHGRFISDRPTLDEAGVRLSIPGGRPALITDQPAMRVGRLIEWNEIERVDAGTRHVWNRTLKGLLIGSVGAALLLRHGRDLSADGDHLMMYAAVLSVSVGTTVGYLYGTGYPSWSRVYP